MTFDDTTIPGVYAPPQIRLRVRLVERNRDLHAAEEIVLACVTGVALFAWIVAFWRWFL